MSIFEPSSASLVFDVILSEWVEHLADIEKLVLLIEEEKIKWERKEPGRRKWSFELQLNRWAREGCRKKAGWISPDTGLNKAYPGTSLMSDLLVAVPGFPPVAVEVALICNVTDAKWISKINRDTEKLATKSLHPGLQIIACFDTFDLEHSESWTCWFPRINIWERNSSLAMRRKILTEGKMLVKAWEVSCNNGELPGVKED